MSNVNTISPIEVTSKSVARQRILKTAIDLFYKQGIRAVGVDQIIKQAHVTRVTFYRHFHSKDQLAITYLNQKDIEIRRVVESASRTLSSPETILHAIITKIGEDACRPGARGCPFLNATNEFPEPTHPVSLTVTLHRTWFRNTISGLFNQIKRQRSSDAADIFIMLCDGVMASGHLDDPARAFAVFTRQASHLIEISSGSSRNE